MSTTKLENEVRILGSTSSTWVAKLWSKILPDWSPCFRMVVTIFLELVQANRRNSPAGPNILRLCYQSLDYKHEDDALRLIQRSLLQTGMFI